MKGKTKELESDNLKAKNIKVVGYEPQNMLTKKECLGIINSYNSWKSLGLTNDDEDERMVMKVRRKLFIAASKRLARLCKVGDPMKVK